MCKKVWAITKLNLKNIRAAYIVTAVVFGAMVINYIITINIIVGGGMDVSDNYNVSTGWMLWLFPALAAVLIPARNFLRTMNLGGKRDNFFWGSLSIYALTSAIVSVAVIILDFAEYAVIERFNWGGIFTAANVFGWGEYGIIAVFFQQLVFLFLLTAFVHTLTAIQDKWYGWAVDITIVAIISVFTPIAPLRSTLVWFFQIILFSEPLIQIPACIILALAIYSFNKVIFARKAI
jgi:hypothetical protein